VLSALSRVPCPSIRVARLLSLGFCRGHIYNLTWSSLVKPALRGSVHGFGEPLEDWLRPASLPMGCLFVVCSLVFDDCLSYFESICGPCPYTIFKLFCKVTDLFHSEVKESLPMD
jgi:hypothetical protein